MEFIAGELEAAGCPVKQITQISIAVEEIFVNIAHYAYKQETGSVVIRADVSGNATDDGAVDSFAVIEFEDGGIPYNPLEKTDPDIGAAADEREIGGLGIFMVKKIMDSVEYRREAGKNILTIRRKKLCNP